jgi:hypothetical protein
MALNILIACAIAAIGLAGFLAMVFVAPRIRDWIASLSQAALLLLVTLVAGVSLLFIPRKFWRMLKRSHSFRRLFVSETKNSEPAPQEPKALLNKKAIKEAALMSRTQEFDV